MGGGDYVLVVKFMGGILSTYTKMSRGGFVRGDYVRIPQNFTKIFLRENTVHEYAGLCT